MERYEAPVRHQRCPTCGNAITQSTDLLDEGAKSEPGDIAICEQCGGFLVMDANGLFSALSDEAVRTNRRFTPHSIDWLFEAQRAVRSRARLLVTSDEQGRRTVTMVPQLEGRKVYHGDN